MQDNATKIIDHYFHNASNGTATRDEAAEVIGLLDDVLMRRANPGKARSAWAPPRPDAPLCLRWEITDDGDEWASGVIHGGDTHEVAYRYAMVVGMYADDGITIIGSRDGGE